MASFNRTRASKSINFFAFILLSGFCLATQNSTFCDGPFHTKKERIHIQSTVSTWISTWIVDRREAT
jgi:hypothetical protein